MLGYVHETRCVTFSVSKIYQIFKNLRMIQYYRVGFTIIPTQRMQQRCYENI